MASPLRLTLGWRTPRRRRRIGHWRPVVDAFERLRGGDVALPRDERGHRLQPGRRHGRRRRPSRRLRRALVAVGSRPAGHRRRFDPRVLADLDRLGYRGAALRTPAAGESTASDRGPVVVERAARSRRSASPRPVDLGGIGKGLALRWATDRLERSGVSRLPARGRRRPRGPRVATATAIRGRSGSRIRAVVRIWPSSRLAMTAIATSSIRVNRWVADGRVVHHLIDPRTGEPADAGLVAVTVAAPDPAWAEVWSKVLFLGGREAIATEARARGLAAWWVTDDGGLEMTPAARAMTIWVAAEAADVARRPRPPVRSGTPPARRRSASLRARPRASPPVRRRRRLAAQLRQVRDPPPARPRARR